MTFFAWMRRSAFRYRGLSPIPFLILALIYAEPTPWGLVTGFVLMCAGEFLRFRAVSYAGVETRATLAAQGTRLVTAGPFAYLRNPMYAGNLLIYLGVGLMSMGLFPWLLLAGLLGFVVQYVLIISYEEDFLKNRFGVEYEKYAARVNRFLPRPRLRDADSKISADVAMGLRSEKRTLQAEVLVVALFVGIYLASLGRG